MPMLPGFGDIISGSHKLILEKVHPSGAGEYLCPDCGRHIIVQPPPYFRRIVLDDGDLSVHHRWSIEGIKGKRVDFDPGLQAQIEELLD